MGVEIKKIIFNLNKKIFYKKYIQLIIQVDACATKILFDPLH